MTTYTHHYTAAEVDGMAESVGAGNRAVTLRLQAGDTAWNPASTKGPIPGPAKVHFMQYPDGGWEARTEELDG